MSELLELAQKIVERATGGEDVEAFLTHERTFQAKAFEGGVESLSSAEPKGAGVRVVDGGRVGFSYTTDLTAAGLDAVVARARDNSRFATQDKANAIASAWTKDPATIDGLFDAAQPDVSPEEKVAFVLELENITRHHDPRIRQIEDAVYADSVSEVALATTSGIAGTYSQTDAWCYAVAIAEDGDDTEVGFDFGLGRGLRGLDVNDVARRSAERALSVLGATKIPSERIPVLFDPYTAAQFLGVLARALTAESAQKQRSLFAGRTGQEIAASDVTLVDDGRVPGAPGSAPWDGEGVPTQSTTIIEGGILRSFLYDTVSARREERDSTGNASRAGFKSLPYAAPTNLAFRPTGPTRDELLRAAGRAFLVQDFHGVHSGANPVSGDFSVGATGRIVENGELGAPVKEVTIAAPMLEILSGISGVADDLRWLPFGGSFGGATTLVGEMTVSGT